MYTVKECRVPHEPEVDYCCLWQAWRPPNVGVHASYMWGVESPVSDQHLAELAAGRQVVGKVKLEVEYVPFKTDPAAKATMARRLTRRMSRSKINADHKGVLTVALIKATNLAVRTPASGSPAIDFGCDSCGSLSICFHSGHEGALTVAPSRPPTWPCRELGIWYDLDRVSIWHSVPEIIFCLF